jgi:hypothetical protein
MGRSIGLAALAAVFALASMAQPAAADNSQQTKMTTCNADAKSKGLGGDARKAFMKSCLSAAASTDSKPLNSQQQKMRTCSADAKTKGLKGEDRKKFMSGCLKGAASP